MEFAQMDNQITYNEALIDERDQGIAEISQQIGEVNEIFQAGLSAMLLDCLQNAFKVWICSAAGIQIDRGPQQEMPARSAVHESFTILVA